MDLELYRGFLDTVDYMYNRGKLEVRLFLAFGITMVFAPWSIGITYFLVFLVAYEVFFYCRCDHYPLNERIGIVLASYLGWLVGRYLVEETRDEDVRDDINQKLDMIRRIWDSL